MLKLMEECERWWRKIEGNGGTTKMIKECGRCLRDVEVDGGM
jgi:hypothetical protein